MAHQSGRSAFKRLIGAVKELTGKDANSYRRARDEVRSHFLKSRNVSDRGQLEQLFQDAKEAEEFIRFNIVQARKTTPNIYSVKLKDPNAIDNHQITDHVDFEPLSPQEAIAKSQAKPKGPLELNIKNPKCNHTN